MRRAATAKPLLLRTDAVRSASSGLPHEYDIGFIRLDTKHHILDLGDAAMDLLHLPRSAGPRLVGSHVRCLWGDEKTAREFVRQLKQISQYGSFDLQVKLRDASSRWFHFSVSRRTKQGRLLTNVSFLDVTGHKQAEEHQKAIATGLRSVVQIADLLIEHTDEESFCRSLVDLIRKRLPVERCSIFLLRHDKRLDPMFAVDRRGRLQRLEVDKRLSVPDDWLRKLRRLEPEASRSLVLPDRTYDVRDDSLECVSGGATILTPILSATQLLGFVLCDNGISGRPLNPILPELLDVLASLVGDMLIRMRSEASQESFSEKLHAIVRAADKLLACQNLDELYRRAVELARSELGVERCAIFLRYGDKLYGTYGTDGHGRTTREYDHAFPSTPQWIRRLHDLRRQKQRWLRIHGPHHEWVNGRTVVLGHGWVGITPIFAEKEFIGIICHDAAISKSPPDEVLQEALIVYGSLLGAIIERKRAEDRQRQTSTAMRTIIEITDQLLKCPDLDSLCRHAVEAAREKLGIERCAIFLFDKGQLRGTYGTNLRRETTEEHDHFVPPHATWLRRFTSPAAAERRLILEDEPYTEWDGKQAIRFDKGWVALTAIATSDKLVGVFSNDTAITRRPPDMQLQEVIGIYCSVLGALIERKQTEIALAESEARFRNVISNINLLGLMIDASETITFCNDYLCQVTGWSSDQLLGRKFSEVLLLPAERKKFQSLVRQWLTSGVVPASFEQPIVTSRGDVRLVVWNSTPLRDAQGTITGLTALGTDMTERRAMESELRRLARAIEQETEAVMICDTSGAIQYVNPAFERITGYSRAEVLGKNPRILKSGKQPPEFYARMWQQLASGEPWTGSFVNRRKDGSLYELESTISPLRDEKGNLIGYVWTSRDVTHEKQLEQRYRHAQRMESVGRLAGGIAHDFNNLLTAILGYARMVQDELGDTHPLAGDIGEIIRAGERAAALTGQLLTFARHQPLQTRPVNLNALLMEMDRLLRRTLGEDIELITRLSSDNFMIDGDPTLLEQVVLNLAVNARDAMPHGGTLTLETKVLELDAEAVPELGKIRPGQYGILIVSDTGVGMTPEVMEHCFEPFFTTKDKSKGSGLGLSIVYNAVEQMHGYITVKSAPGEGSTFTLYFPLSETASAPLLGEATAELPRGTETILLVEDEETVRKLTCRLLESLGYKVIMAAHGEEALQLFKQRQDDIKLILTDVVMPKMSGVRLAQQVKSLSPQVAVLYMSGFADLPASEKVPREALLAKPFTVDTLAVRVRQALDERRP